MPPPPPDAIGSTRADERGHAALTILAGVKSVLLDSHTAVVMSLVVMALQAGYSIVRMQAARVPNLFYLPFVLSLWGASVGVLFEQGDVALRHRELVSRNRISNVPLVTSAFTLVYLAIAFPAAPTALLQGAYAALILLAATLGFLAFTLKARPALLGVLIAQVVLNGGLSYLSPVKGFPHGLLALHTLFTLLGWCDQRAGTLFHVANIVGGEYFFSAILSPDLVVAPALAALTFREHAAYFGAAVVLVALVVRGAFPLIWSQFRFVFNHLVWTLIYIRLITEPAMYPQPMSEEIYSNAPRVEFVSYGATHPRAALFEFNAAEVIPASQKLFRYTFIKVSFFVIRLLDTYFPQARVHVKRAHKLLVQGTFAEQFPPEVVAAVGPATQTRETVTDFMRRGQLLTYIVSYAHGLTMLTKGRKANTLELDFDSMAAHATKPEYRAYGGVAVFRRIGEGHDAVPVGLGFTQLLELVSVQASRDSPAVAVPAAGSEGLRQGSAFRKIEADLLASSLAHCVIGKHCSGIHSYFNLIAVSLHNAFDTQRWLVGAGGHTYPNPFRLVMMPHFYNHVVVEELTTPHLLERDSVFTQIFAYTNEGLRGYYDQVFATFELNQDADMEARLALLGFAADIDMDPRAISHDLSFQLSWELKYHQLYRKYAGAIVAAAYPADSTKARDALVRGDAGVQRFKAELIRATTPHAQIDGARQLPQRYTFDTAESLARFIADTIFCLSIRHEIYGKNSAHYADDWVTVQGQVPRDGGVPSVEEYEAQLYVGLATTRAKYPHFFARDIAHRFNYLLAPIAKGAPQIHAGLSDAFDLLQAEFQQIEADFTANALERTINFELNRLSG